MLSKHMNLVMKLPRGVREQPGWVFIGSFLALVGASYLIGFSQSTVTLHLDPAWLHIWGAGLSITGIVIAYATASQNRPLERLALRLLAAGLLVYMGWVLAVVPAKSTMTVFTCVSLIVSSQIRVAVLGAYFTTSAETPIQKE